MQSEIFLETRDVVKAYHRHTALSGVSLGVPRGSIFGLLGPNGAGKTSLIRIINRITAPDSGQVLLDGRAMVAQDVERIGYLPEERGLYKDMKVGEQALYLARLKGLSRQDALRKLKHWFEKFEIESWWDKKVAELSKGMQQKVQFLVTVLHEPPLLIFDEPFSGFDPVNAELLKREILELKAKGSTILFSTHNMASVEELCDNIALIDRSRKVLDGQVAAIKQQYKQNQFELELEAPGQDAQALFAGTAEVISDQPRGTARRLLLRLTEGSDSNQLVAKALQIGKILSFRELLPSMNDVFLQVVQQKTPKS